MGSTPRDPPSLSARLTRASRRLAALLAILCLAPLLLFLWLRLPRGPSADGFAGTVFAHRGGGEGAPENTLATVNRSIADGIAGVEVDVQLTRDGELVLMHDATLLRTTGAPGSVADYTLAQLSELHANRGYEATFPNERIPTLAAVAERVVAAHRKLLVDAFYRVSDRAGYARAIDRLWQAQPGLYDAAFVSSLEPRLMYAIRRANPRIVTGAGAAPHELGVPVMDWLLTTDIAPLLLGASIVEPYKSLVTPAYVARWRARGVAIAVWTVNTRADRQRARDYGPDLIIESDCPAGECPERIYHTPQGTPITAPMP